MEQYVGRLKEAFVKWCAGNNYVYDEKHLEEVGDYLKRQMQKKLPPYYEDFFSYVAYFWMTGRGVYSHSIVHNIIKDREKEFSEESRQALVQLQKFLKTHISTDCIDASRDDELKVKEVISHFNKSKLPKLDGLESLLDILGEDGFIKAVIENSYFFSPELVKSRFDEMANAMKNGETLYARKSRQEDLYQINDKGIFFVDGTFRQRIQLDQDGNYEVRRVINSITGYTISQGRDSIFQNYYISHIWGRAYDPRYFTSLWNLAIVPVWGNSLMDKMVDNESDNVKYLATKLKSTMEEVCRKLYEMDNLDWSRMGMSMEALKLSGSIKSESGEFSVQVLEGDMRIVKESIRVYG